MAKINWIKLFVNDRFVSKLKILSVTLNESSKKNVKTFEQRAQFMF